MQMFPLVGLSTRAQRRFVAMAAGLALLTCPLCPMKCAAAGCESSRPMNVSASHCGEAVSTRTVDVHVQVEHRCYGLEIQALTPSLANWGTSRNSVRVDKSATPLNLQPKVTPSASGVLGRGVVLQPPGKSGFRALFPSTILRF